MIEIWLYRVPGDNLWPPVDRPQMVTLALTNTATTATGSQ